MNDLGYAGERCASSKERSKDAGRREASERNPWLGRPACGGPSTVNMMVESQLFLDVVLLTFYAVSTMIQSPSTFGSNSSKFTTAIPMFPCQSALIYR